MKTFDPAADAGLHPRDQAERTLLTAIELEPLSPGQYDFTCGMSMLHGKLIVEASGG
jgi:plastocyanin domain-containing protein